MIYEASNRKDEQTLITKQISDQISAIQAASRIAESISGRKKKKFQQVLSLARDLTKECSEAESIHALICTVIRGILAEVCEKLVQSGLIREKVDVFYLNLYEILSLQKSTRRNLAAIIAQRKHDLWLEQRLIPLETLHIGA